MNPLLRPMQSGSVYVLTGQHSGSSTVSQAAGITSCWCGALPLTFGEPGASELNDLSTAG